MEAQDEWNIGAKDMITISSVDQMERGTKEMIAKLPAVFNDIRATAEDRERLMGELQTARKDSDLMNATIAELRHDKLQLSARIDALLAENARIQHLLTTLGRAIKESNEVQDGLAALAATRNGTIVEGNSRTMLAELGAPA
jgi:uncharacterized protein (DUF3084 family)